MLLSHFYLKRTLPRAVLARSFSSRVSPSALTSESGRRFSVAAAVSEDDVANDDAQDVGILSPRAAEPAVPSRDIVQRIMDRKHQPNRTTIASSTRNHRHRPQQAQNQKISMAGNGQNRRSLGASLQGRTEHRESNSQPLNSDSKRFQRRPATDRGTSAGPNRPPPGTASLEEIVSSLYPSTKTTSSSAKPAGQLQRPLRNDTLSNQKPFRHVNRSPSSRSRNAQATGVGGSVQQQQSKSSLNECLELFQKDRKQAEKARSLKQKGSSTSTGLKTDILELRRQQARRQAVRRRPQVKRGRRSDSILIDDQKPRRTTTAPSASPQSATVTIPNYSTSLQEVSSLFREKASVLRQTLERVGTHTDSKLSDDTLMIEPGTMELLAIELERSFSLQEDAEDAGDAQMKRRVVDDEQFPARPPVVAVLGHVDHGKTSLMDALRRRAMGVKTTSRKKKKATKNKKGRTGRREDGDIAGTEAGGITQTISAFQVPALLHGHDMVTFLDTPGHAAFRSMRQSGSDAADIIVLVVAADDGVSAQTVEILEFYKTIVRDEAEGSIAMVVAMNKIDKPGVDVEACQNKIEGQLLEHGIMVEGVPSSSDVGLVGPPVPLYPISAITGEGLEEMIEGLSLQSEVMNLRANGNDLAEGMVMDVRMEKGLGLVADCIIRWGSISKGDVVVSGDSYGKVKILNDTNNRPLKIGVPSQPVRISGFRSSPAAGDTFVCVESEEHASEVVERRAVLFSGDQSQTTTRLDVALQSAGKHMMNHDWKNALERKYDIESDAATGPLRIPVVVKADAHGALAALQEALVQIGEDSSHDIAVEVVRSEVGQVLISDVQLAKESGALLVCFNVKCDRQAEILAIDEEIPYLRSEIIYSLLDDAKLEFAKQLPCTDIEVVHGNATVQATFDIGGIDNRVAGLIVNEGHLQKDGVNGESGLQPQFRIIRKGKVVASSKEVSSLKQFKEDVDMVSKGQECGLALYGHDEYEVGDTIECFSIEKRYESI